MAGVSYVKASESRQQHVGLEPLASTVFQGSYNITAPVAKPDELFETLSQQLTFTSFEADSEVQMKSICLDPHA